MIAAGTNRPGAEPFGRNSTFARPTERPVNHARRPARSGKASCACRSSPSPSSSSPPPNPARSRRSTRSTSRPASAIHYEKVVDGIGPVEKDDIKKGYRVREGRLRAARGRGARRGEARDQEDAGARAVRRRGRDPAALLRHALLRGAGRRTRRGRLPRHPRCAAQGQEDRARPAGAARQGVPRRHQARAARACCSRRCTTRTRSRSRDSFFSDISAPSPPTTTCSRSRRR